MSVRLSLPWAPLALATLLVATGCNTTTTGANEQIGFTPINCGALAGCAFADSIATGGVIAVHIDGLDGTSTVGVDLASRDLELMTVAAVADFGGEPTWEI